LSYKTKAPQTMAGLLLCPELFPAPAAPRPSAQQRPHHQQRLEEQPHQPLCIGIQTKCINTIYILRNISPEDRNKERRNQPPDLNTVLPHRNQPNTQCNLHHARCQHNKVCVICKHTRNLSTKLHTTSRQMPKTCIRQGKAQHHLRQTCNQLHCANIPFTLFL
jgi:hypothetical protein